MGQRSTASGIWVQHSQTKPGLAEKRFRLYWFREAVCDAGTPVEAEDLEPAVREKILMLAGSGNGPLEVHLPFLDRREYSRKHESLRSVEFERVGSVIRPVHTKPISELRNRAAHLIALDPVWGATPRNSEPGYFRTWQRVSLALQRALRRWIPEIYFHDAARFEDRENCYPMLAYMASRVCHGKPRTEFTYDIGDPCVLRSALRHTGRNLQAVLSAVQQRLLAAGATGLARRYAPVWYEDIRRAVEKRPRPFLDILGDEAVLVNAVIDLGTSREMDAVKPFARAAMSALRNTHGVDVRALALRVLDEATKALDEAMQNPGDVVSAVASEPETSSLVAEG